MSGNPVNSSIAKNLTKHKGCKVQEKESKFKYINILIKRRDKKHFSVRKILFRTESN